MDTNLVRIVVATGGHVDHGKTTLIQALTGIDCDRLAEEKRRGMTIDLGFAYWAEDGVQVSVVDVPGHAQYMRNAMAGFGGAKLMLLIVAADEGVRVQTREHLQIGAALKIPYGLTVISKADLVGDERLNEVRQELADLVSGTVFEAQQPIVASAVTGLGVHELRQHVVRLARGSTNAREVDRRFRYAVDRCFHMRGQGIITTGTVLAGRIRAGDRVRLLPSAAVCRIRGVQVHGHERSEALAGERASLQVSGLDRDDIKRGDVFEELTAASTVTRSIVARVRLIGDVGRVTRRPIETRVHAYTAERRGWLMFADNSSGAERLVVIRMVDAVPLCRGDRIVIFRASPQTLLGGGEVLDPVWPGRRRGALERVAGSESEALVDWIRRTEWQGIDEETLNKLAGQAAPETAGRLDALIDQHVIRVMRRTNPRVFIAETSYAAFVERVKAVFASRSSDDRVVPRATVLSLVAPSDRRGTASELLEWMASDRILHAADGLVALERDHAAMREKLQSVMTRMLDVLQQARLTPPSATEMVRALDVPEKDADDALKHLVSTGEVVKVDGELIVAAEILKDMEAIVAREFDVVDVGPFKQRFGLTRRFAIPLLEYLDRRGVTQRSGNVRFVQSKVRNSTSSEPKVIVTTA
jgi:selenocysteine-specific elongation factor